MQRYSFEHMRLTAGVLASGIKKRVVLYMDPKHHGTPHALPMLALLFKNAVLVACDGEHAA